MVGGPESHSLCRTARWRVCWSHCSYCDCWFFRSFASRLNISLQWVILRSEQCSQNVLILCNMLNAAQVKVGTTKTSSLVFEKFSEKVLWCYENRMMLGCILTSCLVGLPFVSTDQTIKDQQHLHHQHSSTGANRWQISGYSFLMIHWDFIQTLRRYWRNSGNCQYFLSKLGFLGESTALSSPQTHHGKHRNMFLHPTFTLQNKRRLVSVQGTCFNVNGHPMRSLSTPIEQQTRRKANVILQDILFPAPLRPVPTLSRK